MRRISTYDDRFEALDLLQAGWRPEAVAGSVRRVGGRSKSGSVDNVIWLAMRELEIENPAWAELEAASIERSRVAAQRLPDIRRDGSGRFTKSADNPQLPITWPPAFWPASD